MALPLTASVVTEYLKRGGQFDGRRVLEVESYYVRSFPGGGWQPCRHAAIDVPVHVTGEVAMVWMLPGPPTKTPDDAARRMWKFIRQHATHEYVWLVDDNLPQALRAGVNLMPVERALAIKDAIATTRTPTIDAKLFLARYAPVTAGWTRTAIYFERPMVEVAGARPRRHAGPGEPPAPTDLVRVVGPAPRERRRP